MKKQISNVAKVLVDARALITIILGLGGMFGLEVQESNAKIGKLENTVIEIQEKADKYKELYDNIRQQYDSVKGALGK